MTSPQDGRTLRSARHRDAILAAANQLMLERGDLDFSAGDLAARAGVSRRTVFNHFSTMDEVITAACTLVLADSIEQIRAATAVSPRGDGSPMAAFSSVTGVFETLDLTPALGYLTNALKPFDSDSRFRHQFLDVFEQVTGILTAAAQDRSPEDPMAMFILVRALVGGLMACIELWYTQTGGQVSPESRRVWFELVQRATRYIGPPAPQR